MKEISDQELCDGIKETIIDVLDIDPATPIDDDTTAESIEAWTSLQHVRIMLALERRFEFEWDQNEITGLKNVGELTRAVAQKVVVQTKAS